MIEVYELPDLLPSLRTQIESQGSEFSTNINRIVTTYKSDRYGFAT